MTKIRKEFDSSNNKTALAVGDLDVNEHAQLHSSTIHFKLSFTKLQNKKRKNITKVSNINAKCIRRNLNMLF